MRKLIIGMVAVASVLVLPLTTAFAQSGYGLAGCGLGSMAIAGRGTGAQIFAATTNGTFGSQTFGITSGTSNCTYDGAVATAKQRRAFAEATLPNILRDASTGRGEYVMALGQLYGCKREALPQFAGAMKQKFRAICQGKSCLKPSSFLSSVETQLGSDRQLKQACPKLAGPVVAQKPVKLAAR